MIDGLTALGPILYRLLKEELVAEITLGKSPDDLLDRFHNSMVMRAGVHFREHISMDDADIDNGAAMAFISTWEIAEKDTMRRVLAALSTPAAKGHEVDILSAVMSGARFDDALAAVSSAPVAAKETAEERGKVIPLRP